MATLYAIGRSGQSLAFGAEGSPLRNINDRHYYPCYMLGDSVHSGADGNVPLPTGLQLKPIKSALTESIDMGWALHYGAYHNGSIPQLVFFYHGWAGYALKDMNQGTDPYKKGLTQLQRIVELAAAKGDKVVVNCYDFMSGESDSASFRIDWTSKKYEQALLDFQQSINTDYCKITGQSTSVKMMFCQTSSHTFYHQLLGGAGNFSNDDRPTCAVIMADLANKYPDRFVMPGAKYHLPPGDGAPAGSQRSVHLNSIGYERWGEKRGQIYLQSIVNKKPWKPLQMKSATVSGSIISIEYDVPFAPIQFDTNAVTDPGNKGFLVRSGGEYSYPLAIKNIETSNTSVLIELLVPPNSANLTVEYAWKNANPDTYTEIPPAPGYRLSTGPQRGPRGCLCDSDPTRSLWNHDMRNWAIHQIIKVV